MSASVLDTNIVSYAFRRDSRAALYEDHVRDGGAIAFVTLGELYAWPLQRRLGTRRTAELERLIGRLTVLPIDDQLARRWAALTSTCKARGRLVGHSDSWIAATALRHGLPLVTHNRRHFAGIDGLEVISFAPK